MIITHNTTIASLDTDFCIIGGGPAAIAVAIELLKTRSDITILAGGGEQRESAADQDLNRGIITREGSHESLEENRRRVFGGASSAWGGRCIPFDRIDFEERSWIPDSGWPISYDQMTDYYRRATSMCHAGECDYDSRSVFPFDSSEILPGMDYPGLESWHLERWSTPINFSSSYRDILERSANVRVLVDTHLLELHTERSKEVVSMARVIRKELRFEVRAKIYVLATGGIENARLLLASKSRFHPNGIGNDHDLVGRFYMCHPHGKLATVTLRNPEGLKLGYQRDRDGVYCRRRWWITELMQKRLKIGNVIFFLDQPNQTEGHRDVLFSSVFIAKSLVGILRAPGMSSKLKKLRKVYKPLSVHLRTAAQDAFNIVPLLFRIGRARFTKGRRLPSVLPQQSAHRWAIYFQAEQTPRAESRITLSEDQVDAHGMARAVVDLVFSQEDYRTVIEAHRIIIERLRIANVGDVLYNEADLEQFLSKSSQSFNSAAHHIGTTRMALSADRGVVDLNGKVFGLDNLYVAGSSVFPTAGHANPTLTIVALAVRLGVHLSTQSTEHTQHHGVTQVPT